MSTKHSKKIKSLALPSILAICLSVVAGCARQHTEMRSPIATVGSNCYAKAMPTAGEGSLAWGPNLQIVRTNSIENCRRYAGRSGGTPTTCKVVEARCKH
ncbi:hypothetical protein NVV94_10865 [Pseudomonas sp. LS1212]|uniref:hypothetical protein n=1 Tax=Pseudomonas sp. LS1212 TaxID=2972478 RepID=UPI00215C1D88|nr:hypothetical protein [Pseudomonas sp. LS1212]UVJ45995.1 hypothetical protein NVV94_10865 [Pseudomonas sp. LS1212]